MSPIFPRLTSRLGVLTLLALLCGRALTAQADLERDDLRKQIAELQAGQQTILRELDAIKAAMTAKGLVSGSPLITTGGSVSMGSTTAKVAIVEFSDFQCPYCASYFSQAYPIIYNDYVKTGKVIYFFRDFPLDSLHPTAVKAAEAARCAADQGKFREMHDRLFMNQQTLDARYLPGHAAALGLDAIQFKTCLDGGKYSAQVKNDTETGQRLGVMGTPTFFLGKFDPETSTVTSIIQMNGVQPYPAFKKELDRFLNVE